MPPKPAADVFNHHRDFGGESFIHDTVIYFYSNYLLPIYFFFANILNCTCTKITLYVFLFFLQLSFAAFEIIGVIALFCVFCLFCFNELRSKTIIIEKTQR